MSEKRSDLDRALEIVRRHRTFIGPAGAMEGNVAKPVAEGIALGREEGIALAAEAIARLKVADLD